MNYYLQREYGPSNKRKPFPVALMYVLELQMFAKQKSRCLLQRINMCANHALLITPLTPPTTLVDNDIIHVISAPRLPLRFCILKAIENRAIGRVQGHHNTTPLRYSFLLYPCPHQCPCSSMVNIAT